MSSQNNLLNIKISDNANDIFIHIYESINFYNLHIFYEQINLILNTKKNLILDFKYCVKIDTSFLALLIKIKEQFKSVKIQNYTDSIKHILSLYDKISFEYI
jgi:ABC-type transporter Mla MlaB component